MASTNPFQHADDERSNGDESAVDAFRTRRRARKEALAAADASVSGLPAMKELAPVLGFLALPAMVVLMITVTGGHWPKSILYPIALVLGLIVAISAFKGVELVLACLIIYLPFSKVFVVPLAPGVNGTNMLLLLGLFAAVLRTMTLRQKLTDWPRGTTLVAVFGLITCLSAVTISMAPGGRVFFLYNEILSYKAWVDQFLFYFIVLTCIRDVETAKRCVVYMMIGSVLVVLYSVPEMLDKMGRSTIEKSRIGGPHLQSNNFGGFVAYTVLPLIALFIMNIRDIRAWLLTPYFLLTAKILITTFSRGAYLAMVAGGLMAGWFKGRGFLAFWLMVFLSLFLVFPSLIPESILARMDSVTSVNSDSSIPEEEKLDKSSSTRLIMWRAASQMILESPVIGKGFKGFPYYKADYTEVDVKESDPHSMYLYLGSQMGLPALALFLVILVFSFNLGRLHAGNRQDRFIRAIGIGGASATACYAVVCIFGSRAVNLNFTAYFWTYLVIMQVLAQARAQEKDNTTRVRSNAFVEEGSRTRASRRQQARLTQASQDPGHSRFRGHRSVMHRRGAAAARYATTDASQSADRDTIQNADASPSRLAAAPYASDAKGLAGDSVESGRVPSYLRPARCSGRPDKPLHRRRSRD